MEISYFKAIQGSVKKGHSKDVDVDFAKRNFEQEFQGSINYIADAKRNGVEQRFLVTASETMYKADITAFPGEDLYDGDMIECLGEHWIVTGTKPTNPIYRSGIMWMCNQLFRFQFGDSQIVEKWGVLDSGVYSTTLSGDYRLRVLDKQYKIYLPYDEDTKKLAIDKRFATSRAVNNKGEKILTCYEFTGLDPISKSYEAEGHLLVLNARSSEYIPEVDNYDEMICDYIPPSSPASPVYPMCKIIGSSKIGVGKTKTYSSSFFSTEGAEVSGIIPSWSWTIPESLSEFISLSQSDGVITISVKNNDSIIGEEFALSLTDENGTYSPDVLEIEVSII